MLKSLITYVVSTVDCSVHNIHPPFERCLKKNKNVEA